MIDIKRIAKIKKNTPLDIISITLSNLLLLKIDICLGPNSPYSKLTQNVNAKIKSYITTSNNISFNTNISISGHKRSVTALSRVLCILSFVCAILCLILCSSPITSSIWNRILDGSSTDFLQIL
jgi:hypothetical protein